MYLLLRKRKAKSKKKVRFADEVSTEKEEHLSSSSFSSSSTDSLLDLSETYDLNLANTQRENMQLKLKVKQLISMLKETKYCLRREQKNSLNSQKNIKETIVNQFFLLFYPCIGS